MLKLSFVTKFDLEPDKTRITSKKNEFIHEKKIMLVKARRFFASIFPIDLACYLTYL